MNYKVEISGLNKVNKNGRLYSSEAIEQCLKDPAIVEMSNNHTIPVLIGEFDPNNIQLPVGHAWVDEYKDDVLNISVNIADNIIKNIEKLYVCPYGYAEITEEIIDGKYVDVVHKYEILGFNLLESTSLIGNKNNCRLIPA